MNSYIAPKVEIYTWKICLYSQEAKDIFEQKNIEFIEYQIDEDDYARDRMAQRTNGRRSLPQIFINNEYIGGCDDLYKLEEQGKLDQLLIANRV